MSAYIFSREPKHVPKLKTKYRTIESAIPAPGTAELLKRLEGCESRSMQGQMPIVWNKASNFLLEDIAGNQYIDFTSAIFVANVGHSNDRVTDAIKKAVDQPLYCSYAYAHQSRVEYQQKLVGFAGKPFEKSFLLSAGTEATEAALKLMRMHGKKQGKRKGGIICIANNWHGRTLGAQMMSSNLVQKEWIGFQDPNIYHIPFPYPWVLDGESGVDFLDKSLAELAQRGVDLSGDICGFMLETFQGWGAIFYPKDYVQAIERICKKHQILLTFDEMQAGFARTGRSFGYQHYEVEPDLICCGKGMGGGLPLSGVIGKAEIMDLPDVGNMSSTHSANPLVCAAGLAVLDEIIDKNIIFETKRKGEILFSLLNQVKNSYENRVSYVLGRGLIAALLFRNPKTNEPDANFTSRVAERCMQKGVLVVHTGRESIKLGPPLTITDDAIREAIDVITESISEIDKELEGR